MKLRIVNLLGTFGYISVIVQWLLIVIVLGAPLASNNTFKTLFLPTENTQPIEASSVGIPGPIAFIFVILAVVFMIGLTVYAIYAVPKTVGQVAGNVSKKGAKVVLPAITHHKKISKKREIKLIERITWSIKLIVIILPLLLLLIPVSDQLSIDQNVVTSLGLLLAVPSLVWFSLQLTLSKLLKIDNQKIW